MPVCHDAQQVGLLVHENDVLHTIHKGHTERRGGGDTAECFELANASVIMMISWGRALEKMGTKSVAEDAKKNAQDEYQQGD